MTTLARTKLSGSKHAFSITVAIAALVWTAVIFLALINQYLDSRKQVAQLMHEAALQSIQKDLLYRSWAADHGGVYVPVTAKTRPNPYLQAEERDITTPSGRKLTLINPPYMTRQVHELGALRFGDRSHLTSSKPVNPANRPDVWEVRALAALERGNTEFGEMATMGDDAYYRLMVPLRIEESCLKCHAAQGYRLGDLRGGISAAVPMKDYEDVFGQHIRGELARFGTTWLLGMVVMLGTVPVVKRRMDERDAAAAALEESEARYRSLFEQSRDAIFMLEAEGPNAGRIVSANRAALDMHGYSDKDIGQLRMKDLLPPGDTAAFADRLREIDREGSRRYEVLHRRKNGTDFLVEVTETLIAMGGRRYCMSVSRDFSDLKRSEEQRRKLEEQLIQVQKIESLGRLAGGVAHDINNMLTPIMGYAQILSDGLPEGDYRKEEANSILRSALRVRDVARQLLAFARKQTLDMKVIDLNAVLIGFEKMLRRTIRENIVIETKYVAPLPPVLADAGQIEQVILNLAVNAQDAMPNGGRLRFQTRRVTLDKAFVEEHKGAREGEYLSLAVTDNGTGMAPDVQAKVFEPFFTTKERGRGPGLGLAMVYGIVKQHDGYVDVVSEVGTGTTFTLYIPVTRQQTSVAVAEPAGEEQKTSGRETVLVLEDQKEVLGVVTKMLGENGYRVLQASSPRAALALAEDAREQIELFITDVIMPGMTGTEVFQRLRAARPSLKVLYMSGHPEDVISTHGVLRPGIHFIQKPFVQAHLLNRVRDALGREAPGTAPGA